MAYLYVGYLLNQRMNKNKSVMKKFKINAIRTDEYIVEIDETVWNKEALNTWNKFFGGCDTIQELAEHISFLILRFGYERFLEGFGYLYVQDENCRQKTLYKCDDAGKMVFVTEFAEGIRVTIISEDDEYDFETEKLE